MLIGNTENSIFDGITDELSKKYNDGDHLVIVPDRFSMNAEKMLLEKMRKAVTFNVEVVTFSRLAQKLLKGKMLKCLSPEGAVAMLSFVIEKNKDNLQYYKKSVTRQGFVNEFYAQLTSIRNSGITPQDLKNTAQKLPKNMAAKIEDTAFLYEKYLEELQGRFFDSSTRLEVLADELENLHNIENENFKSILATRHIYVAGFSEFKAPELKIVKQLILHSKTFCIGIVSGYGNDNSRIYPNHLIYKIQSLADVQIEKINVFEKLQQPFDKLSKWLYSYAPCDGIFANDKIEILKAQDITQEIQAVAMEIKNQVCYSEKRYMSFGVAVPNFEDYAPYIQSVFERFEIPFFLDKQESFIAQSEAQFLLSAFDVVGSEYEKNNIMVFASNRIWNHNSFEFQNYVDAFNIDRTIFLKPFDLDHKHVESAEKTRQMLVQSLNGLDKNATANEYVEWSKAFFETNKSRILEYRQKLIDFNTKYEKILDQVDKKFDLIFEEICNIYGDFQFEVGQFRNLLYSMIAKQTIAILPLYIDSVFVGDAKDSRFSNVDTLFIVGAVEGKFPSLSTGGLILSDSDEKILKNEKLEIFPSTRRRNLNSMYQVVELCLKPKNRLVISYPEIGANAQPQIQSSLITQMLNVLCDDKNLSVAIKMQDISNLDFDLMNSPVADKKKMALKFCSNSNCYAEILQNCVAVPIDKMAMLPYETAYTFLDDEQKEQIDNLYRDVSVVDSKVFEKQRKLGRTSISQLEKFYNCPYGHYFSYGLELRKREEAKLLTNEQGSIIHEVLEKFFRLRLENKKNLVEKVEKIFDEVMANDRFQMLAKNSKSKGVIKRLKKEAIQICDELFEIFQKSKFKPYLLEGRFAQNFDQSKIEQNKNKNICDAVLKPLEIEVGRKKYQIVGQIDRVDKLENQFVIYDYKTFKTVDFDLSSVYFGKKLQLYIYSLALTENFDMEPVGLFYLPIYSQYSKDKAENRYKMSGHMVEDINIASLLDSEIEENIENTIFPYYTATGKKSQNRQEVEDFKKFSKMAKDVAVLGMQEICDGYIKPKPLENSCDFCDFSDICKYKNSNIRKLPKLKKEAILMALENEEACEQKGGQNE